MCLWEQSDPQPGQTSEGQDEWQHHHLKLKEETAEVLLLFVFQKMTIRLPGGTVHEAGTWVNAGVGE